MFIPKNKREKGDLMECFYYDIPSVTIITMGRLLSKMLGTENITTAAHIFSTRFNNKIKYVCTI